jgi:MFS family permease
MLSFDTFNNLITLHLNRFCLHGDDSMNNAREKAFYLIGFPVGHGAIDAGTSALWVIAPAIALSMDLSKTQVGLIFSVIAIAAGVTHIPAGLVGETRFKRVFLLSTLWWVAGAYLVASLMPSYWILLFFLALASSGAAAWHPIALGTMAEYMPNRRAYALGVHFIGGSFMEVLAPLVAGFLLVYMDWRSVMQIITIPALLMGVAFLRLHHLIPPSPIGHMSLKDLKAQARLVGQSNSLVSLGILGLHNMALMGLWSMTPLYLVEERGISPGGSGALFSIMVLSGSLGAVLIGRLIDRYNRKAVALSVLIAGALSPLLILWAPNLPVLVVGLIVAGFAIMGLVPALIAIALSIVGGRQMVMIGLIMAAGEIIGALGAVLAGLVGETDLRLSLALVTVFAVCATLLVAVHPFTSAVHEGEAIEVA